MGGGGGGGMGDRIIDCTHCTKCDAFVFKLIDLYSYILYMQMIWLYKDPEGENVFSNSAGTRDVGSLLNVGSLPAQQQQELQHSTEDSLRRRIRQLENMLSTYTV